jgi:phosphonate transport system substrate-binding protein
LKEGKIDVAFVCGGPYVDGHEEFGLELLAAP